MQPYAEKNASTHELEGFEAVVGMAEQLPFSDDSFDRAVCTLVHPPFISLCTYWHLHYLAGAVARGCLHIQQALET